MYLEQQQSIACFSVWSVLSGFNTEKPREVMESGSVRLRKSVNVANN